MESASSSMSPQRRDEKGKRNAQQGPLAVIESELRCRRFCGTPAVSIHSSEVKLMRSTRNLTTGI